LSSPLNKGNEDLTPMDFPATIKLTTGEEIFAIVLPEKDFLMLYEPVIITEIKTMNGDYGYKIEPWLKTADDDMFIVNRNNIITLSECKDKDIINYHLKFIAKKNMIGYVDPYEEKLSKKQGYVSNVNIMRNKLEQLLNSSPSENNPSD
jgi:hypothetical protein